MHTIRSAAFSWRLHVPRNELFAAVFLFGFANGVMIRVCDAIESNGLAEAILATFGISVFVWIGAGLAIMYVMRGSCVTTSRSDLLVSAGSMFVFALPVPYVSWLCLTLL